MRQLSNIIAGTMRWGLGGRRLDVNTIAGLIDTCNENQITTFDLADIYGGYTTEADFGNAFKASKIDRSQVQFITKCGIQAISDQRGSTVKHYNYSKSYITKCVESSLLNLKTDYLDVLLLHRPSPLLNPKEVADTIQNLIQSGKILSFGVSNFTPSQINLLKTLIPVSYNQIEISITEHSPLTNGSLDYLMEHNIQTMSWSPLGTIFTTKNEQNDRILKVLKQLTDKYNADEATLALAWILSHPANVLPVIGSTNPERISKLANTPKIRLDLQDWFLIYTASLGKPVA